MAGLAVAGVAAAAVLVFTDSFGEAPETVVDNDVVAAPADDADTRSRVIDAALNALDHGYVFSGVARDMAQAIRAHDRRGAYDGLHGAEFAQRLTDDLRAVSDDKHLTVRYPPGDPPDPPPRLAPSDVPPSGRQGISRVEQLPGNVGLIAIANFVPPNPAARTRIADVMDSIHETDALIIDLRHNEGGSSDMVPHVLSYLLGRDPMPVTSFHDSDGNLLNEHSTTAQLQGPRYGHTKDVYVLTSKQTISGGEAFAYDLKHFDRATIVGETTAGAAHPVRVVRLPSSFEMRLPFAQPLSPVTGTNWEGHGVEPDIAVPAGEALDTALDRAKR